MSLRLAAVMVLSGLSALAEPRALLAGVGKYKAPISSLPGIEIDINNMRASALAMGFKPDQIRVLLDDAATSTAIAGSIRSWIAPSAGANDPVLIYFSGHGAQVEDQNGDETDDRMDEFWVTSDSEVVNGRVRGYLLDDEIDALLALIKSNRVLVILDTCHSGSGSRDLNGTVSKNAGMRGVIVRSAAAMDPPPAKRDNHVLLSAARDNQTAGATREGSHLTNEFAKLVRRLAASGQPLSLTAILPGLTQSVTRLKQDQQPVLSGNSNLRGVNWFFGGTAPSAPAPSPGPNPAPVPGPSQDSLDRILSRATGSISVTVPPTLRKGDVVSLSVNVPQAGFLNVVNFGDGDAEPIVLFPNRFVPDGRVEAGQVTLPGPGRNFRIRASLPAGAQSQNVRLYVFFTETDVNLFRQGVGEDPFRPLSPQGARALEVEAAGSSGLLGTKVAFTITQ